MRPRDEIESSNITPGSDQQAAVVVELLLDLRDVAVDIRELLNAAEARDTQTCGICGYQHSTGFCLG